MRARSIIRGMANRSIPQSFVLLHSTQFEMVLIVAIVISSNLKWLEPWASKKACRYRGQGSHMLQQQVLRSGKWYALNNEYVLISEMRPITRPYFLVIRCISLIHAYLLLSACMLFCWPKHSLCFDRLATHLR